MSIIVTGSVNYIYWASQSNMSRLDKSCGRCFISTFTENWIQTKSQPDTSPEHEEGG